MPELVNGRWKLVESVKIGTRSILCLSTGVCVSYFVLLAALKACVMCVYVKKIRSSLICQFYFNENQLSLSKDRGFCWLLSFQGHFLQGIVFHVQLIITTDWLVK